MRRIPPRVQALIDLDFRFEKDILDHEAGEDPVPVWPHPGAAPTRAEIDAKVAEYEDKAKDRQVAAVSDGELMVVAKALLNHENRLRALEGKPAATEKQFRDALKALLA